ESGLGADCKVECGNSVFYDLKNNHKINWRSLLWLVALRIKNLTAKLNIEAANNIRALIIDDSPLPKSGIKAEFVSRVHDHVSGDYIFGYKILVLGYWDGVSFYAVDFSIHREKGNKIEKVKKRLETANRRLAIQRQAKRQQAKILAETKRELKAITKENKNKQSKTAKGKIERAKKKVSKAKLKLKSIEAKYVELHNQAEEMRTELKQTKKNSPEYGLTKKQMNGQFSKDRQAGTPGAQRAEEVDVKKTTNMMAMLRRAIRRGFIADYVLVDSWFFNLALVKLVVRFNKKTKIHLLAMAKMNNTKYMLLSNNRFYGAKQLLVKFKRKAVKARSHKAQYIKIPVTIDGIRINLFFVKIGRCRTWKLLVTTDLKMNFQKLMNVYQIRWSIELFFREAKQYLNLGKCKSTCFDAQIADATICLAQYAILSFHRKISDYGSFDGIFASALEDALQNSIASELQKLFVIIIEIFSEIEGVELMEMTRSIITNDRFREKIKIFKPIFYENLENLQAA
ncbi:MAG: transposase, partial [Bacteroidetes bacterium]|nr:transposase [Bacteroidota bacterium]